MPEPRVFSSLREALNASAYGGGRLAKNLAAELDWAPSEFTMRVTLGGDSARHFPANDEQERLVRLMSLTGDFSYLATLADLCGFEIAPKRERLGALVSEVKDEARRLGQRIEQLVLQLGIEDKGRKR